jgi:GAF domain-containing protein
MLSTGTIDLLAILSAARALSSETTIEGLHARVGEVLAAMTGATAVRLLPTPAAGTIAVGGFPSQDKVPMAVLRYAQRMHEPLVVADATSDDRFARDPYFADVDRCALLALPILSRGRLRAVLLVKIA